MDTNLSNFNNLNKGIYYLKDVSPKSFWGVENANFKTLEGLFPEIRIVARDHMIKIFGSEEERKKIIYFIDSLCLFYQKHNTLTPRNINELFLNRDKTNIEKNRSFLLTKNSGQPIKAKSNNQQFLIDSIAENDMVFALGPAGTGKTYLSVALAVLYLKEKKVNRIVLTRPAVETGENLGFLPGDIKEKLDPYMQPIYDALYEMFPKDKLEHLMEERIIEIAPLAFMRGRTLNNAFVILDEAQNTTFSQMKMFLTRMGRTSKFIITADPRQVDLSSKDYHSLSTLISKIKAIEGIGVVNFSNVDIMRHRLVKEIIDSLDT